MTGGIISDMRTPKDAEAENLAAESSMVFKPFQLEEALAYHLAFHSSNGIHYNHLIFLHCYVFGVLLLALSIQFAAALAVLALYTWYCVAMDYYLGMTYSTVLVFLFILSYVVWAFLLKREPAYFLSAIIILGSLGCQLIGHRIYEAVQAPVSISHGFFAAPFLEWCSLFYRRKRNSKLLRTKFDIVGKNIASYKLK